MKTVKLTERAFNRILSLPIWFGVESPKLDVGCSCEVIGTIKSIDTGEDFLELKIGERGFLLEADLFDFDLEAYKAELAKEEEELKKARLQEEPVSEDLKEAAEKYAQEAYSHPVDRNVGKADFIAGAKWQKEHLWKPADGDDLPEYDRGVIVLTQTYPLEGSEFAVSFAHRPNPNGWDGKSITTGKVEHYTPMAYGKGGWNIPNIVYWLDVELPKE